MFRMITGCDWPYWAYCCFGTTCQYGHVVSQYDRAFSLTWPASVQIFWNKRNFLLKKRVQLSPSWFGTPTWPPFYCFGTPIWLP